MSNKKIKTELELISKRLNELECSYIICASGVKSFVGINDFTSLLMLEDQARMIINYRDFKRNEGIMKHLRNTDAGDDVFDKHHLG